MVFMRHDYPSERAFSLIEIMISLSIMGLILVMTLPGLMNFYHHSVEEQVLLRLLRVLTFAHQEAVIKRMAVAVCKSSDSQHCLGEWSDGQIVFVDSYGDGSIRSKEQVLAVRQGIKQNGYLYYRAYPHYRNYLLFTSHGWMANDNGTFWYCAKEQVHPVWALVLAKSGIIRTVYPNAGGQIRDSHGRVLSCLL